MPSVKVEHLRLFIKSLLFSRLFYPTRSLAVLLVDESRAGHNSAYIGGTNAF